jgi:hypothetical protein
MRVRSFFASVNLEGMVHHQYRDSNFEFLYLNQASKTAGFFIRVTQTAEIQFEQL